MEELTSKEKRIKEDNDSDKDEEVLEEDKNKFSNDGSFLELFKSKMKKESKDGNSIHSTCSPATHNIKSIQAGVGRPKALQKSLELREKRKRRREELEEQKRIEESQQSEDGKAWRKYLAEMKAYEERLCMDKDNNTRPLVK